MKMMTVHHSTSRLDDLLSRHRALDEELSGLRPGELDRLRGRRDEILAAHVSVGHVGGGNGPGGGGIEPRDVFALNLAIDEASGLADLESQIATLEREIGPSAE